MAEHCGYVVKITELRKHSNADRLQVATIFGNSVIVGMDTHVGDIGIYFPVDLQLSEEFCQVNDLVRRKDENGNAAGGYLEPGKRNIRAMKLRGEISDGLYLPITCLAEFTKVSDLNIGDTIDVVNGHEICCKYVPRVNNEWRAQGKKTADKVVSADSCPTFFKHVDTAQLAYNLDDFKNGDIIQLTLKMHGCFVSGTKVRMGNGDTKEINNIKIGDKVLGYNFETKSFEEATVLNVFHNDKSSNWRKIKFSREGLLGDKRGYVTCTYNHPFWVNKTQEWVQAEDLTPGMEVDTLTPSYILTQKQKEILAGILLGDGHYESRHEGRSAEIQNSSKDKTYLEYIHSVLGDLYSIENKIYTSGYGSQIYRGRTVRCADLANFFNEIFVKDASGNQLTESLINIFSPLTAAFFYMDDGSLGHSDFQKDRALIAICNYNEHDGRIIQKCFKKYDIDSEMYTDTRGYNRLRFNTKDAYKLFDLIAPYICDSMRYKLPEEYRNLDKVFLETQNGKKGYVFSKQVVLENFQECSSHYEFDLETSLHNYVVGNVLVHNTSGRTGYLLHKCHCRRWYHKLFRLPGKECLYMDYVTGTRNVILDSTHKGGFYDDNSFRLAMAGKFEGKLHENETAYYEIVSWTGTNGDPIMAPGKVPPEYQQQYGTTMYFTYGCDKNGTFDSDPPCCDIYVYRMTMVNDNGDVVEYSPAQIKYRCEQMGIKTVPEFETFIIPSDVNPGEYVMRKVEQYYDGPDPIGKTHIREGVVARILNRNNFAAYKHKNYLFKYVSGIAASSLPDNVHIDEDRLEEL
mgnify:CR=1 FL=1